MIKFQSNSPQAVAGNDTSKGQTASTVTQQLADQYQLYQQLPDGHVQVYKLPAGIVPILVPTSSDDLKHEQANLQPLQLPVQAQVTGMISNKSSSISNMNCALMNNIKSVEHSEGNFVLPTLQTTTTSSAGGDLQKNNIVSNQPEDNIHNRSTESNLVNEYKCSSATEPSIQVLSLGTGFSDQVVSPSVDSNLRIENQADNHTSDLACSVQHHIIEHANTFNQSPGSCPLSYGGKINETSYAKNILTHQKMQDEGNQRETPTRPCNTDVLHNTTDSAVKQMDKPLQSAYIPELPQPRTSIFLQQDSESIVQTLTQSTPTFVEHPTCYNVNTQQAACPSLSRTNQVDINHPDLNNVVTPGVESQNQYPKQITNNDIDQGLDIRNSACCLSNLAAEPQKLPQSNQFSIASSEIPLPVASHANGNMVQGEAHTFNTRNESVHQSTCTEFTRENNSLGNRSIKHLDMSGKHSIYPAESSLGGSNFNPDSCLLGESKPQIVPKPENVAHQQLCETCGSISVLNEGSNKRPSEDYSKTSYDNSSSMVQLPEAILTNQSFDPTKPATKAIPISAQEISKPILIAPQNTPVHPVKSYTTPIRFESVEDVTSDKNLKSSTDIENGKRQTIEHNHDLIHDDTSVNADSHTVSQNVNVSNYFGNNFPQKKGVNRTLPFSNSCSEPNSFPYFANKFVNVFDSVDCFCLSTPISYDLCTLHATPPAPPTTPVHESRNAHTESSDTIYMNKVQANCSPMNSCLHVDLKNINEIDAAISDCSRPNSIVIKHKIGNIPTPSFSPTIEPVCFNKTMNPYNCQYNPHKSAYNYKQPHADLKTVKLLHLRQLDLQPSQRLSSINGKVKSSSTESISTSDDLHATLNFSYQGKTSEKIDIFWETSYCSYNVAKKEVEIPNISLKRSLPLSSMLPARRASAGYIPLAMAPLHEETYSAKPKIEKERAKEVTISIVFILLDG